MARKKEVAKNTNLLNLIAPIGIKLKRGSITIGENVGKVFGIVKYPPKVNYGWLSKVTNMQSSIVSITFKPMDSGIFIDSLSKNISLQRVLADSTRDLLTAQRAEKSADDGEKVMLSIDQNGETVGLLSVCFMPLAQNSSTLSKLLKKVDSLVALLKCKKRLLSNLQEQAFKHISPFHQSDNEIMDITGRVVPLSTFVGGFPWASSGFTDTKGAYFAKDSTGGLVVIDFWKREADRTNSNIVIMGVAGVGKSTAVKHLIMNELELGTRVLIADPDGEYPEMTLALGGEVVNVSGGGDKRINPLEVRSAPIDDESEKDNILYSNIKKSNDLVIHLKTLEVFWSLYIPNLTDMQKALIKDLLIDLYKKFNITWDTDISLLNSTDFPIMTDLYELLIEKHTARESSRKMNETNIYEELVYLLKDIAYGADSHLWNGYTTLKTDANIVCIKTGDLQDTAENIKRAIYFNILTWCWQEMSKDRTEKVYLVADEAYLMIDPNIPQSIAFLRNVEKRSRKYEAGVAIVSHSVVDFLDPKIKMYGQALLDIPCFKILMGTDGQNIEETKRLYNLKEAEVEELEGKKRGRAIFIVGSKRVLVDLEIPEYQLKLMGTAGGR